MTPDKPTQWYFAYGSNLCREVREERRALQPLMAQTAVLHNYSLAFNHPGIPVIEPCFANLRASPGSRVFGMVYQLSDVDACKLNNSEGENYQIVDLTVYADNIGEIDCFSYVSIDTIEGKRPSRRYLHKIINGASENSLPDAYIDDLRQVATTHIPVVSGVMDQVSRHILSRSTSGKRVLFPGIRLGARRTEN